MPRRKNLFARLFARRKPAGGIKHFLRNRRRLIFRLGLFGFFVLAVFYVTLPDIDDLHDFTRKPSILLKSESGEVIGSFGDVYGDFLSYDELPTSLVDAVLATEDRNFFYHFGIDPIGLIRATFTNIRAGHVVQGGSTITQQVAKNVFLTPERSFIRKFREILLAFKLEYRFTKKQIMSIYLNCMYLGSGHYGVDAASRRYFNKSARQISLPESAIIAGLLKAPSKFSPTANPELSRQRAEQVLVNMHNADYLTDGQLKKALDNLKKFEVKKAHTAQSNLYFADWIIDQMPEYVGKMDEDLVVVTTLNPKWQFAAEEAIRKIMDEKAESFHASQAALVALTPDGAVRCMIGGRSYAESQYNRAAQALRQPGSAFKLFVYLAGLEAGITPDTVIDDQPITLPIAGGTWSPKNYTHRYEGPITVRDAVTHSINTVAVQVSEMAGREKVIDMAQRLGITADMDPVPSIALGATDLSLLQLTAAYAHMAANGKIVHPYGILSITTANGKPLYVKDPNINGRVLSGNTVALMNSMLTQVIAAGTGQGAAIGRPAAGKTGTTSDYRDAWFIGYTPQLTTGVWVGNDNNSPMKKVTGGTLPAPIWRHFMRAALADQPVLALPTQGSFWGGGLPWQENAPPTAGETAAAAPEPSQRGVTLGPSFWGKLMGREEPPAPVEQH